MKKTKRNRRAHVLAALRRHTSKRERRKAQKRVRKEVAPTGTHISEVAADEEPREEE